MLPVHEEELNHFCRQKVADFSSSILFILLHCGTTFPSSPSLPSSSSTSSESPSNGCRLSLCGGPLLFQILIVKRSAPHIRPALGSVCQHHHHHQCYHTHHDQDDDDDDDDDGYELAHGQLAPGARVVEWWRRRQLSTSYWSSSSSSSSWGSYWWWC